MIIAIDGPAASGKSTTAKKVAARLNWLYMDTWAMYRAITLACMREKIDLKSPQDVASCGYKYLVNQEIIEGKTRTYLNDEDVSEEIRLPEVTRNIKPVADHPEIRSYLVEIQRKIGHGKDVVVDGRDIGTVVFPDANLKIFMIASIEERAKRRFLQLQRKKIHASMENLVKDIATRDDDDKSRPVGALIKADDAVELDTTELSIEEQVQTILDLWHHRKTK
jgi:CMP/dCMP kinase